MKKKVFVVMGLSVLVSSFCFNILESNAYAALVENEGQGILEKSTKSSDTQSDSNELNVSVEENDNSDKTAEEISKELEEQMKKETEEANGGPTFETGVSLTYSIDEINFPDPGFRAWVASNLDADGDVGLSEKEIEATTSMIIEDNGTIFDLTGIELFTNLQEFKITGSGIINLNLSNMTSIKVITIDNSNNNLKSLDVRGCTSLSTINNKNDVKIFISPKVFKASASQHCIIAIDLAGNYKIDSEGNKVVDLSEILSHNMIDQFSSSQKSYDFSKNLLVIPQNQISSSLKIGTNTWKFYTKINNVTDVTVLYESNGGSLINEELKEMGSFASKPVNPTKSGYIFEGWYVDNEFKTPYDFSNTVNDDITLYAKWRKVNSSGGLSNIPNTTTSTTVEENETKPICPDDKSKDSTKVEAREESGQSVVKQTGSTYLNNLIVLSMLVVVSIAGTVYTVQIENKEA